MRPTLALALALALATRSGSSQATEPRKPATGTPATKPADPKEIKRLKAEPKLGKLTSVGGSILEGTVLTESIRVKCDLGELEIPLRQVMTVNNQRVPTASQYPDIPGGVPSPEPSAWAIGPDGQPVSLRAREPQPFKVTVKCQAGNAIVAGEIVTKEFKFSCAFGVVTVPWDKVAALDFVPRGEPDPAPVEPPGGIPANSP